MLFGNARRAGRTMRAFTLIELLVVIAIIAVLASILFPVFSQARDKARSTTCLTDMKQIGLGVMQYVQDYDETYPRLWFNRTDLNRQSWARFTAREALIPYVRNGVMQTNWNSTYSATPVVEVAGQGVWKCPSQPWEGTWRTYALHSMIFTDYLDGKTGTIKFDATHLADINSPAQLVMISENGITDQWNTCSESLSSDWWWHGGAQWPPQFEGANSGAKYDRDPTLPEMSTLPDSWTYNNFPRYRHNKTSNFIFSDGHVKAIPKGRLNWCKNIYFRGMKSTWDAGDLAWLFDNGQPCSQYGGMP